jgi:hypothetical protein
VDTEKLYLKAEIVLEEETSELKAAASKIIDLPKGSEKQPDLAYFSAIFVSTGENLNHAYFAGSELVAAEGTITNKALDIEHEEEDIIGHIYARTFIDKEGNKLDLTELASKETASLDKQDMHIAIAGIIYKNRFPEIAKEVAAGKFCVSMECYYQDYDVKIGELIMTRREADALGLASESADIVGKVAKVLKKGKEIASGTIARVLRNICFSGCGIVKNPANPPSVILETAKEKHKVDEEGTIILDYDALQTDENEENNNVTSDKVDTKPAKARDGNMDDTVNVCASYKRRLLDKHGQVVQNDWCTLYDAACTSFSRDTSDPNCLRTKEVARIAKAYLKEKTRTEWGSRQGSRITRRFKSCFT